jgi:hypothetical protein
MQLLTGRGGLVADGDVDEHPVGAAPWVAGGIESSKGEFEPAALEREVGSIALASRTVRLLDGVGVHG